MRNLLGWPRSGHRFPAAWLYVPLGLFLVGLGVWAVRAGNDLSFYWRDPAAIVNTGPWIGFFSNIGIFIWWIAGAVSVFTALLLWNVRAQRRLTIFLLAWGLFTGLLALDDFFMIHEWVIPTYLPLSDNLMFGVYTLVGIALAGIFRDQIRRTPYLILMLAVACFGVSTLIDLVGPARFQAWGLSLELTWNLEYVVEDGLKLFGVIAWAHYFLATSFSLARQSLDRDRLPGNGRSSQTVRERAKVG